MRYLISALDDLGEMFKGRRIAPIEFCETGRKSLLTSFGYQGMSMIAVAGRDMAARDAPARAAGRAGRCAAGRQRRPCAGVQQQWPRVEIPTDRRVRASSRARMRIQLPACNTRIPTPATLGQPESHCPSNRCAGPWKGSCAPQSGAPHPNCVCSAYRFRIGASGANRQCSERNDSWSRQRPCSNSQRK